MKNYHLYDDLQSQVQGLTDSIISGPRNKIY